MAAALEDVTLEPTSANGGPFRTDIYQPAGYVLQRSYRPYYKRMLELQIRDDDVWIISYPKCGSTWISEMVWLLRHKLDFEAAKQLQYERVPFIEYTSLLLNRSDDEQAEKQKKNLPLVLGDSLSFVDQWPKSNGSRTIKSHLQWNLLPIELKRPNSSAKIIYVAREAKDVCISFYHQHKLSHNISDSFEEYTEHFMGDRLMYAPFWHHLLEYWSQRDRPNLLYLKYDDMKKDISSVIRRVNNFLSLDPLTEGQMQKLKDHLSFDSMKNNPSVNQRLIISSLKESGHVDRDKKGEFFRKGIVGDWKEKMNPDMVKRFDEWTNRRIAGSGLNF